MRKTISINGKNVILIYAPTVHLINQNLILNSNIRMHLEKIGYDFDSIKCKPDSIVSDDQAITEMAARTCYQSWNEGREHREHVRHLASVKHYSVFEHNIFTFALAGISRSLTHELVRHRHMSFSQLSQRYVDHSDPQYNMGFVVPPDLLQSWKEDKIIDLRRFEIDFATNMNIQMILYTSQLNEFSDLPKKRRQQLARCYLPACIETRMVVSGNARAWLEACLKRCPPGSTIDNTPSDQEIWRLFDRIKSILAPIMPDFWSNEYPEMRMRKE
jgi:thymidylate synthase (FAD)